jgi:predicted esterase
MRPAPAITAICWFAMTACAPAEEQPAVAPLHPASAAPPSNVSLPESPEPVVAAPSPKNAAAPPTSLEIPGFDPATLSFPGGAEANDLVLVAAHGAGDSPAEQCRAWRRVLGERGIVLCLAGPRVAVHSDGRYFPDHFALEKIVLASLDAFRKAFPNESRVPIVYAGYSQGATMGSLMIVNHGDLFPRLALVEGGFEGWTLARAEKFKSTGGRRVLFVCGTKHCRSHAESSAASLRKAALDARVVSDLSAGHTYGGAVAAALENSLEWLVREP